MGLGQKFLTRAGSAIFGLGLSLEIFPLKIPNFTVFSPSGQQKIASVRAKKYPGQRWVGLLFTEGQKYARVRSGSISILEPMIGSFLNDALLILSLDKSIMGDLPILSLYTGFGAEHWTLEVYLMQAPGILWPVCSWHISFSAWILPYRGLGPTKMGSFQKFF